MAVYFDHNATTPLDPRVLEAMQPFLVGPYGNPSSVHRYGRAARDAIEAARTQVAAFAGAQAAELIWTGGATEANNLAVKGIAGGRVLYGATEHPSVMEAAESLRAGQRDVAAIAIDRDGLVDWAQFEAQLAEAPPSLVALMVANNETGVIQDVPRAAALVHATGGRLLADAVQAAGKIDLPRYWSESRDCADMMSLSAHKIGGPKGVGALLVKTDLDLAPQLHGGGQEHGRRGGTENLAGIVGFGVACELAGQELAKRATHTSALRELLETGLAALPGVIIFGCTSPRLPNTVQFAIPGWEGEALLMALDRKGVAVSSGSACASGTGEPSHVLLGMGYSREIAFGAIRVSFGPSNTDAEIARLLELLHGLCMGSQAA